MSRFPVGYAPSGSGLIDFRLALRPAEEQNKIPVLLRSEVVVFAHVNVYHNSSFCGMVLCVCVCVCVCVSVCLSVCLQWLNGFSDFACGIAAVGDDINVGSCAGNLRVLDDPSEESTALAVTFAVPKGKTCGTTIMYPGPSLSRDHVRREDVWSNIRSSSVLLLDGSLLLNSADVVAMVLEQASKQPKVEQAVTL